MGTQGSQTSSKNHYVGQFKTKSKMGTSEMGHSMPSKNLGRYWAS